MLKLERRAEESRRGRRWWQRPPGAVRASSAQAGEPVRHDRDHEHGQLARDSGPTGRSAAGGRCPAEPMPASGSIVVTAPQDAHGRCAVPDAGHDRRSSRTSPRFRGQPFTLKAGPCRSRTRRIHFFGTTADGSRRRQRHAALRRRHDGDRQRQLPGLVRHPAHRRQPHVAIGRFPGRNTRATAARTARSARSSTSRSTSRPRTRPSRSSASTLPPHDQQPTGVTTAYLMALTLRDGRRHVRDARPLDEGPVPERQVRADDRRQAVLDHRRRAGERLVPGRDPRHAHGAATRRRRLAGVRADPVPDRRRQHRDRIVTRDTAPFTSRSTEGRTRSSTARSTASATPRPFKSVAVRIDRSAADHDAAAGHRATAPTAGTTARSQVQLPRRRRRRARASAETEYRYSDDERLAAHHRRRRRDRPLRHERLEYRSTRHRSATSRRPRRSSSRSTPRRPSPRCTINGAAPRGHLRRRAVRVVLTRDDGDGSGAAAPEYRVDGGEWTEYTGAFDVAANGVYRIDYRSWDVLGNVELYRPTAF